MDFTQSEMYTLSGLLFCLLFAVTGFYFFIKRKSPNAEKNEDNWIKKNVFSRSGFCWTVLIVFMIYSAQNVGYLFSQYDPAFGPYVGYIIDAGIVYLTNAMLTALAHGQTKKAALILFIITFCCSFSFTGNLIHNLEADVSFKHVSGLLAQGTPILISTIPFLIIALSWFKDFGMEAINFGDLKAYKTKINDQLEVKRLHNYRREEEQKIIAQKILIKRLAKANKALEKGAVAGTFRFLWQQAIGVQEILPTLQDQFNMLYEGRVSQVEKRLVEVEEQRDAYKNGYEVLEKKLNEAYKDINKMVREAIEKHTEYVQIVAADQAKQIAQSIGQKNGKVHSGNTDPLLPVDVLPTPEAYGIDLTPKKKPGPGRPLGTKNKPKVQLVNMEEEVYAE